MYTERCPVCEGRGVVPKGFYDETTGQWGANSTEPEICRACNGRGFILVSPGIDKAPREVNK
jgi:DnaJ-class molecular chaperone